MRRARLTVAYNGATFRGFAENVGVPTVMGTLRPALERVLGGPVQLTAAGRTDAGVHAWGQVISGDLPVDTDLDGLSRRVSRMCAPHIAVRAAAWAEASFDARFDATWRRYRYHVWNDPVPNPLLVGSVWHVPRPIDLAAMQAATAQLVGEHDFSSFGRRPSIPDGGYPASMVRVMYEMTWRRLEDAPQLLFEVRGSAFCHQQVRSMVGTTIDVGLGRVAADDISTMLAARDRNAAGSVAPPEGLVLWEVGYDGQRWDAARD